MLHLRGSPIYLPGAPRRAEASTIARTVCKTAPDNGKHPELVQWEQDHEGNVKREPFMKTCGTCNYYIKGKALLGNLFTGSVCLRPEPEPSRSLRVWRDKPLTETCWTPKVDNLPILIQESLYCMYGNQ